MTNHRHKTKPQTIGQPADIVFTDEPLTIPEPDLFLNYEGYHLGQLGQVKGPMMGHTLQDQMMTVVSESYDTTTHTTRLGLKYGIIPVHRMSVTS